MDMALAGGGKERKLGLERVQYLSRSTDAEERGVEKRMMGSRWKRKFVLQWRHSVRVGCRSRLKSHGEGHCSKLICNVHY